MIHLLLRRCSLSDLDEVEKVEIASFSKPFSRYMFYFLLKNYPEGFIVVDDGGRITGYVAYSVSGGKGSIVSIAVLPDYRRRGIGQMLVDYAVEDLRKKVGYLELQVNVSNVAAINFYKKNNFVLVETISQYYPDGGDAYLMRKMLN
ncbi:MAG: ribosomal protein S18-alanine N-acetyltransferase [Nitrososphaeria archaeon]|jgi:ribosomal-protein-alanine N-acetyltransferase